MNFLKGWKTILFNIASGAAIVTKIVSPDAPLPDAGTLGAISAALNLVLRAVTNTSIFSSTSTAPGPNSVTK